MKNPSSSTKAVMDEDRRFLQELEKTAPEPVAQKEEPDIDAETVGNFLQAYVKAAAQKDPRTERSYFGDSVLYFNRGPLGPKALEEELAKTHRTSAPVGWMGLQGVAASGPNTVRARFSVRKGAKFQRGELEVREATIIRLPKGGLRMIQLRQAPAGKTPTPTP